MGLVVAGVVIRGEDDRNGEGLMVVVIVIVVERWLCQCR